MLLTIQSVNFDNGQRIPEKYTCEGPDISPELRWENPPEKTESFAILCDDPDAPIGNWNHWVVFDIPSDVRSIPEGATDVPGIQGKNDFGDHSYGGPCPPPGKRPSAN